MVHQQLEHDTEEGQGKFGDTPEKAATSEGMRQKSGPGAVRATTGYRHCQRYRFLGGPHEGLGKWEKRSTIQRPSYSTEQPAQVSSLALS